jgi:hypothetical protein
MDQHGVVALEPRRPNTSGGVVGGRTTYYRNSCGAGNVLLTCHAAARAFGPLWDEIDISRSHVRSVLGCWTLTGQPRPISHMRYAAEPDILEADIAAELAAARPHRVSDLTDKLNATGGVPRRDHNRLIIFARKSVLKCSMAPKQVMSAMINAPTAGSWEIPFEGYPHLMQLFADLRKMRRAVLSHPLCRAFTAALHTATVPEDRAVSLCLGHLDDCALAAARTALHAAGCTTGLTINDSLFVSRRCPLSPAALVSAANAAASHALSFPVTFSFLPHLTKPTDPTPTLVSLTSALTNADPSPPASGRSTPITPGSTRNGLGTCREIATVNGKGEAGLGRSGEENLQ